MAQTKQLTQNSLAYYLNLKYQVVLYHDEDGGYTAEIKELPGCLTQAETIDELWQNIEDARILWIETAYEYSDPIPLPVTENQFSGKCLLRMPSSLHRKLSESAEQEGVSLNQYLVYLLSEQNTARQYYHLISEQSSKNMKIQGIKQGKNITLTEDLTNIADGMIEIEISVPHNLSSEERKKQLDELCGSWKDNPQTDKLLTKINEDSPAGTNKLDYTEKRRNDD